ncbi:hypothetical protein JRO89_XS10G0074300 [Xanthoceras sorbifolium]|uniref:Pseudouridine-5'-phosphate glycosidase n=1 Tax=Xanthoceras sorbifolium TaxID=99658 RepID=A0ABQ8HHZ3_9ROSI|nr:hypothetical protein JRO89_XS10G0074300 [Xanthoceras sorbifolium]
MDPRGGLTRAPAGPTSLLQVQVLKFLFFKFKCSSSSAVLSTSLVVSNEHGGAHILDTDSSLISVSDLCSGMPFPKNLETAKEVEAIVRENGAVAATIAILDGIPCVGLSTEELERLAKLGSKAQKTARRDIAHVVAMRANGATTVSATMFFASMVGIPVFVTGGIGGVHRHGEHTMDISSDLTELGKTPVAVISAGVKSILDIPRTLEYLETQGVCVAAYKTHEFPAFFTESSGCKVPCRVDSPDDCARLIGNYANEFINFNRGVIFLAAINIQTTFSGHSLEQENQRVLAENQELQNRINSLTIVRPLGDASTSQPVPFDQATHTTYYAPVRPDEQSTTAGDLDPILAGAEPNIRAVDRARTVARHSAVSLSNGTDRHQLEGMARVAQEMPPTSTPNGNVGSTQQTVPLPRTPSGFSRLASLNSNQINPELTLANLDLE